jgi:predicted kinase
MRRLPDDASLLAAHERGELTPGLLANVARRLAGFHRAAARGPHIAALGRFDVVAGNARENFEQSAPEVGTTVSPRVFARLRALTEASLADLRPLFESRAARDLPCDGHGDLRLEHIYSFPDEAPPDDLLVIDCVEYTERFRFADPVNDIAFTVMELLLAGKKEAAQKFVDAYVEAANDEEGRRVLDFYVAYRSIVRAKVRGFELRESEIAAERRAASLVKARAHFLLALGILDAPGERPALALVGGLPGTGKSTLAHSLAEKAGFEVVRSDVVRKELAGIPPEASAGDKWKSGIYAPEWTRRTYEACLGQAEARLLEGKRVVVDATFAAEEWRLMFLERASRLAVPAVSFVCEAPANVVRERLARRRGDASDANVAVYEEAQRAWAGEGAASLAARVVVDSSDQQKATGQALEALARRGLR